LHPTSRHVFSILLKLLSADQYSAKPYVLFYTTKRGGGGVQDFDAIKLLKFAVS
jgi:HK97 family phage major capsid protein